MCRVPLIFSQKLLVFRDSRWKRARGSWHSARRTRNTHPNIPMGYQRCVTTQEIVWYLCYWTIMEPVDHSYHTLSQDAGAWYLYFFVTRCTSVSWNKTSFIQNRFFSVFSCTWLDRGDLVWTFARVLHNAVRKDLSQVAGRAIIAVVRTVHKNYCESATKCFVEWTD